MRILISSLLTLALAPLSMGCLATPEEPAAEGRTGSALSAELDGGLKTYLLTQSGVTVAAAWSGSVGGVPVEYWAALSTYSATASRNIVESSQSCADWKRTVCGSGWSGATYYKPVVSQTTLNCAFPPGPCTPPTGGVSFLGSGSYRTLNSAGAPFAWTYVASSCEYWAMDHTISTGTSVQSPLSPAYTSLSQFETSVCAISPVPSTWFSVSYVPDATFCSDPTTC